MEGDVKHFAILPVGDGEGTTMRPSFFEYSWLSDDTLVYDSFGGIRVLDIQTGKAKDLIVNVPHFFKKNKANASPAFENCLSQTKRPFDWKADKPVVIEERIFFNLQFFDGNQNPGFRFALNLANHTVTETAEAVSPPPLSNGATYFPSYTEVRTGFHYMGQFEELQTGGPAFA